MNAMEQREKFVTRLSLRALLEKLRAWLPFDIKRKINGVDELQFGQFSEDNPESILSVGIGSSEANKKSAIEIQKDGDIYIYNSADKRVKLQNELDRMAAGGVDVSMTGYSDLDLMEDKDGNPLSIDTYTIKNDDSFRMAIKKLDGRTQLSVVELKNASMKPQIGREGVIYVDLSTGAQFVYDTEKAAYIQTTPDIISGGDAATWA